MKKYFMTVGTIAAITAPIISIIGCASKNKINRQNGIFTEYVRAHDLALSLGIAPAYHARSDISSTHDLINEGYLDEFSNSFTKNGKRYNGGDREYFSSLKIGVYISRSINDSKGYFTDVKNKIDVINSDSITDSEKFDLNWKTEIIKVAKKLDEYTNGTKYSIRAKNVLRLWERRETKLKADADNMEKNLSVILVRGSDDDTLFDSIVPSKHLSQLYGLNNISMPKPSDSSKLQIKSYAIFGKNETNRNQDLLSAFASTANKIIYLKTPKSVSSNLEIKNKLKSMTISKDKNDVLIRTYDKWYLPFRGAAIGANVAMDNIEKDIINNSSYTSEKWKKIFNKSDLENLLII